MFHVEHSLLQAEMRVIGETPTARFALDELASSDVPRGTQASSADGLISCGVAGKACRPKLCLGVPRGTFALCSMWNIFVLWKVGPHSDCKPLYFNKTMRRHRCT